MTSVYSSRLRYLSQLINISHQFEHFDLAHTYPHFKSMALFVTRQCRVKLPSDELIWILSQNVPTRNYNKVAIGAKPLILLDFSIKMFSTTTAAAKLHCHTQCKFTELLLLGLSSSAWNMTTLYTSIIKAAAKLSAHLNMLLAYISSGQATSHNPFNAFIPMLLFIT